MIVWLRHYWYLLLIFILIITLLALVVNSYTATAQLSVQEPELQSTPMIGVELVFITSLLIALLAYAFYRIRNQV